MNFTAIDLKVFALNALNLSCTRVVIKIEFIR